MTTPTEILAILDACAQAYAFPMLDNGYVYLAATRLALFRSTEDWAMVIEVFGYSPRAGLPDLTTYTFGSTLRARRGRSDFVSEDAYRNYLGQHPHDEHVTFGPLEAGAWLDDEDNELLAADTSAMVVLRGAPRPLPSAAAYAREGIALEEPGRVRIPELCRYLAAVARDEVLATPAERRAHVGVELEQLLVLDEWHHPDLINGEWPSAVASFRQLAEVLATGEVARYQPTSAANTHWQNWPGGGRL